MSLLLLVLACADDFDARDAFADCSSEMLTSDGVLEITTFNQVGWPERREVYIGDDEPIVYETEYNLVVGSVTQSVTTEGPRAELREYDGRENLRAIETNIEGDERIECTLTYGGGDLLERSVCTDGTETLYDACGNPSSQTTPEGVASFGYTYDDCQILNRQILGTDAAGPFAFNEQFFAGRPVSNVREQADDLASSITVWDCPAPVE
jgi:hypothetical protein